MILLLAVLAALGIVALSSTAALAAPDRTAAPRIVGGNVLTTNASAPYTVAIQTQFDATSFGGCSGTVLGPLHVLTAAHCFLRKGVAAAAENVRIGIGHHEIATPEGRAATTVVTAAALHLHPLYREDGYPDDVAVVTLAAPIDFSTGTVAPLAMVPVGGTVASGTDVRVTGFGVSAATANDYGTLRSVRTVAQTAGLCGTDAPAVLLCTFRKGHAACEGDSGGTATIDGGRLLAGVTDVAIRNCAAGLNLFANVAAPEIRSFIDGVLAGQPLEAGQIPLAPRGGRTIRLTGSARIGRTVTCRPGRWTGGPSFRYSFVRSRGNDDATTRLSPKRTYNVRRTDRGRTISCTVEATNTGGTGGSVSQNERRVRTTE